MSKQDPGIERDPTTIDGAIGPEFDLEVGAFATDIGRVTLRTLCEGNWFPKSPVDLYEALMDAEFEVVGGGNPTNEMIALAMELLYKDAWWLDFQRVTELDAKCDVSRFIAEPSDVFEVEFDFGTEDAQSLMVYNMTQFPLSSGGFSSLSYLMTKMMLHADIDALTELDRIIIAASDPNDAFFFYCQEWIVLSAGLFERSETISFDGKVYSKNAFLDRVAQSMTSGKTEPILPLRANVARFDGYAQASPLPVWVQYDPTFDLEEAS